MEGGFARGSLFSFHENLLQKSERGAHLAFRGLRFCLVSLGRIDVDSSTSSSNYASRRWACQAQIWSISVALADGNASRVVWEASYGATDCGSFGVTADSTSMFMAKPDLGMRDVRVKGKVLYRSANGWHTLKRLP